MASCLRPECRVLPSPPAMVNRRAELFPVAQSIRWTAWRGSEAHWRQGYKYGEEILSSNIRTVRTVVGNADDDEG